MICNCQDWNTFLEHHPDLFIYDIDYGWILSWVELKNEKGYTQVSKYGISINYCPICGGALKEVENAERQPTDKSDE